jgi:light-regulated signal transduction histidine kinase (bacteriophytochrome)
VQLFHAGIARYLHQPFSAASVDDCVRHVIGRLMQERTRRALEADLVESQEKLRQAVEDLEDSNTELERFAYIISHDLQEPLRNVSNYVQLLKKRYSDELDQDAHEFIEFASGGARRMRQLIQGLLEYSRVSTRGQAREPVDMQEVLQDVRHDLEPRIGETGASVTSGDMPTVQADPIQMRRLIQNLLGNALKFRSEEPPRVHVGAARKDGFWKFQVEDNGIGIRRDQQSSIFNIYRRLHREPQYEGTGIGLAVCKKIVERHGGHIWVHSHPGEGSTFFFTVPIEEAEG